METYECVKMVKKAIRANLRDVLESRFWGSVCAENKIQKQKKTSIKFSRLLSQVFDRRIHIYLENKMEIHTKLVGRLSRYISVS